MNDNQDQLACTPEDDFNLIDTAANQQAEYSGVKTQSARIAQLEDALARLALQMAHNAIQGRVTDMGDIEWVLPVLEDK